MTRKNIIQTVPEFLKDTLATTEFRRFAGEWDIRIPVSFAYGNNTNSLECVKWLVERFRESFSWLELRSMLVGFDNGTDLIWDSTTKSVQSWLTAIARGKKVCVGMEAEFNALLYWCDMHGVIGRSWMSRMASLIIDKSTSDYVMCTFTIWPNFFTNEVYIYKRRDEHSFDRELVSFDGAAEKNRSKLYVSLREWEARTKGEIVSFESELVNGVERFGFSDHSVSI